MGAEPLTVCFIVPCFNEADNVKSFFRKFADCFNESGAKLYDWKLLFIDDGSTDGTWEEISEISAISQNVNAIRFSRNFGKEAAIWAGLCNSTADYTGIIDADLQQPPSDALAMCRILDSDPSVDCVAAFQRERYESGLMGKVKQVFYSAFSRIAEVDAIQNASDFRVFRKKVRDAIITLPERFRFSKGIFAWIGFETYAYPYQPQDRAAGSTKWSPVKLFAYAVDGMLAFSVKPLRAATILGLFAAACSVVYFVIVIARAIVVGIEVPGYATLMSVVLLLGGVQLVCMGIIGEYLARTYLEGKARPIFVERDRLPAK